MLLPDLRSVAPYDCHSNREAMWYDNFSMAVSFANRVKFSPSALSTYLQCSQKYYFAYDDEYVRAHRSEFDVPRPYLTCGSMVHLVANRYFNYPPEQRGWQLLGALLRQAWPKPLKERGGFSTVEEERQYYQQALDMLKNFLSFENQQHIVEYTADPESRESLLESAIGPDIVLTGRVDRVDREADGLHVIDYKTGKSKNDDFQIIIYTMLAESKLAEPVARASYFYLSTGEFDTVTPYQTLRRETTQRVTTTAESIRAGQFAPRPSKLCGFCEYLKICPARELVKQMIEQGDNPTHQDFFA